MVIKNNRKYNKKNTNSVHDIKLANIKYVYAYLKNKAKDLELHTGGF